MRGAIAAGHRLTAEAGAEILAEGGNAVDACLAAAFASWVAESPLTGPAAGGFLLVHRARDRTDRLLDFFVALPGRGSDKPPEPHMESIDIDFDGSSSQVFLVGPGSCAVPGSVAGLEAAHKRYASLPWRRLIEPAIALARDGVELTPPQAYLHAILDLILRHTAGGAGDLRRARAHHGGRADRHARSRRHARAARRGWCPRALRRRARPARSSAISPSTGGWSLRRISPATASSGGARSACPTRAARSCPTRLRPPAGS